MPILFFLFLSGCSRALKKTGNETASLFLGRLEGLHSLTTAVIYDGEITCRGDSYPFLLAARVSPNEGIYNFYTPTGEYLSRLIQIRKGEEYTLKRGKETFSGEGISKSIYRFAEKVGDDLSLKAILLGDIAYPKREGDLFSHKEGFIFKGLGFTIKSDGKMRFVSGSYEIEDGTLKVGYSYSGELGSIPSILKIQYYPCRVTLRGEKREGGKSR